MKQQIIDTITKSDDPAAVAEQLRRDIVEGLAAASGSGYVYWTGDGQVDEPSPAGGWTLVVHWAVQDQSYSAWYPEERQARAALEKLAIEHSRTVDDDRVDLTMSGCLESFAFVR